LPPVYSKTNLNIEPGQLEHLSSLTRLYTVGSQTKLDKWNVPKKKLDYSIKKIQHVYG
jgi:hypothetical protein